MKYALYFILKAIFVLEIVKVCPDFFGHFGKRLNEKTKVNFKILTPQPGKQTIYGWYLEVPQKSIALNFI